MAAELLKRLFHTEIQPLLFPGNNFLARAVNDDSYVNNNTVELPHSGTLPNVKADRTVLPAPIVKRTDVASNYTLEELTTDPTHLGDSEALIVSYNKRASILEQHAMQIRNAAAVRAINKWAAGADAAHIIASTGSARAAGNTWGSQTSTRKAFTLADIVNVQTKFFSDDVQNELGDVNGVAVITPAQYSDLIKIAEFNNAQIYGQPNIPSGVVRRAFGFDFYVRSKVALLNNSDALKTLSSESVYTGATNDQDAAIFYHPSFVRRAVGAIKPFINEGEATLYGDVMSMLVRFGASPVRNDSKGLVVLFEDN